MCARARRSEFINAQVGAATQAQQHAEKLMLEASADQSRLHWELCVQALDNRQMLALVMQLRLLVNKLGRVV